MVILKIIFLKKYIILTNYTSQHRPHHSDPMDIIHMFLVFFKKNYLFTKLSYYP